MLYKLRDVSALKLRESPATGTVPKGTRPCTAITRITKCDEESGGLVVELLQLLLCVHDTLLVITQPHTGCINAIFERSLNGILSRALGNVSSQDGNFSSKNVTEALPRHAGTFGVADIFF